MPRDFDPKIGELSEVYLYSVDDLQQVCDRNIQLRRAEWPKAERIIEEETKKFLGEMIHRGTGSTIQRLREQADKTREEELARLLNRLQLMAWMNTPKRKCAKPSNAWSTNSSTLPCKPCANKRSTSSSRYTARFFAAVVQTRVARLLWLDAPASIVRYRILFR